MYSVRVKRGLGERVAIRREGQRAGGAGCQGDGFVWTGRDGTGGGSEAACIGLHVEGAGGGGRQGPDAAGVPSRHRGAGM